MLAKTFSVNPVLNKLGADSKHVTFTKKNTYNSISVKVNI